VIGKEVDLTSEEKAMLQGSSGEAIRRAMEIIVALARVYGARNLVPVASVQVAGVSYMNLGDAGLDFLLEWADAGAQVCIPTMLNPAGMDLVAWEALGVPRIFAHKQRMVVEVYAAMGIEPTCTCTPYLVGHAPEFRQHLAWSESSAVSFANSVLGARTNREGGPSALASAIVGRTAEYGLHLDDGRLAHCKIDVRCRVRSLSDFGALGYLVGQLVSNGIPYFCFRDAPWTPTTLEVGALPPEPLLSELKLLGAAMAASGAVALYHVEGVTPEARMGDMLASDAGTMEIDDLSKGYAALNSSVNHIDLVSIGCPHASLDEIRWVGELLDGKKVTSDLWVTTARKTREEAERLGLVERIEVAGGQVVADACLVVSPVRTLGYHTLATNSAKMAFYAPSHVGLQVRFGSLEQCIEAAIEGKWEW